MNHPGETNLADSLLPDIQNTQNYAPNDTFFEENSGACAQEILEPRSSTIPGAGSAPLSGLVSATRQALGESPSRGGGTSPRPEHGASLRNDGGPSTSSDGGPTADTGQEPTGHRQPRWIHIRMSLALDLLYQIMLQQQIFHAGPTGSENQKHTQMAL